MNESANNESANSLISMRTPIKSQSASANSDHETGITERPRNQTPLPCRPHTPSPHHSTHTVTGSLPTRLPSAPCRDGAERMPPCRQRPPGSIVGCNHNGKGYVVRQQRDPLRPGRQLIQGQCCQRHLLRARRQARVTRVIRLGSGLVRLSGGEGEPRSRGELTCPLALGPTPPGVDSGASPVPRPASPAVAPICANCGIPFSRAHAAYSGGSSQIVCGWIYCGSVEASAG